MRVTGKTPVTRLHSIRMIIPKLRGHLYERPVRTSSLGTVSSRSWQL